MNGYLRTTLLLAGLTAIFLVVGQAIGGNGGMLIALVVALGMNVFSYWNSDKLALRAHKAQPIDPEDAQLGYLHTMLERLAQNAGMPLPKLYIMQNAQPNAFATGRNPEHAAVAVTTGLLERLSEDEVAGVVAHELAHIKNRDTLIMTISATMAGALGMMAKFGMMFGRGGRSGRGNPIMGIIAAIFAPMAAMLVQMTISRAREYEADRIGAEICKRPNDLADALEKISGIAPHVPNPTAEAHPTGAHMFIFRPLIPSGLKSLFSTHPPAGERIRRLRAMELDGDLSHHGIVKRTMQSSHTSPWA